MLFVITGPSGCGKSTLVKRILDELEGVEFSVSFTTRKKRESEVEGRDYCFVSENEFRKMIEENCLVEWAEVHGHFYGTSREELVKERAGADLILDIDVQGARQIKEKYEDVAFIFVLPPVFPELRKRLQKRGEESQAEINRRLEGAKREIEYYRLFDYIVINDDLDKAAGDLSAVIVSQRCRKERREEEILPIIASFSGED